MRKITQYVLDMIKNLVILVLSSEHKSQQHFSFGYLMNICTGSSGPVLICRLCTDPSTDHSARLQLIYHLAMTSTGNVTPVSDLQCLHI